MDGWIGMERDVDQTEGYVRRGAGGIGVYGTVIQELGRKTGVYIRGLWGAESLPTTAYVVELEHI